MLFLIIFFLFSYAYAAERIHLLPLTKNTKTNASKPINIVSEEVSDAIDAVILEQAVGALLWDQFMKNFKQDSSVCGNIHAADKRAFWLDVLKADKWTRSVLEKGYIIPFKKTPPVYQEPNNKSAKDNPDFVNESLPKLLKSGVVQETLIKPRCVSPLTVAIRVLPDGERKMRLCWDGSRCINPLIKDESLRFADLNKALQLVDQDDYMGVLDLTSCYHHLRMNEEMYQYLGFSWTGEDGVERYYYYTALPFGLKSAAFAITRLTKCFVKYFAALGIPFSIFIDDGKLQGKTKEQTAARLKFVIETFQKAGWVVAMQKSDTFESVSQAKKYLGFRIESRTMTLHAEDDKIDAVRKDIEEILQKDSPPIKELAQVAGRIISLLPAVGPICSLLTRSAYFLITFVTRRWGWKSGKVRWSSDCRRELALFSEKVSEFNGQPINREEAQKTLQEIVIAQKDKNIIAGDASAKLVCAYDIHDATRLFFQEKLTDTELSYSSGHRELCTIKKALLRHADKVLAVASFSPFKRIIWLTDAENVVIFLTKGSRKEPIQKDILLILELCHKLNITIIPVHLSRNNPLLVAADEGTRVSPADNWGLSDQDFNWINDSFGDFSIDLFADPGNKRNSRYYSLFHHFDAIGVDAFTFCWTEERVFCCPPTHLIIQAYRKILLDKCSGILIVPEWRSHTYWPILFSDGIHCLNSFKIVRFIPKLRMSQDHVGVLQRDNPFTFLAIEFSPFKTSPLKDSCTDISCNKC